MQLKPKPNNTCIWTEKYANYDFNCILLTTCIYMYMYDKIHAIKTKPVNNQWLPI